MDLYYLPASTPCRSVLMTAAALGIKLNKILVNTWAGEHLTPEYLKRNPQHTIPTLVDDGFSLWESRAIMIYLVEKYGKDDSLYPKCPKKQAVLNQRLYFDMDPLCTSFVNFYFPQFRDQLPADPELLKKVHNALEFLNTFLEGNQYVAGDSMTIADFALLATVSTFDGINFDFSKFKNIIRWYNHCKTIAPGWEENLEGCVAFKNMYIK